MPIDFNLPQLTTNYNGTGGVLASLRANILSLGKFMDGDTITNPVAGVKKYDAVSTLFQEFDGSAWSELPLAYAKTNGPSFSGNITQATTGATSGGFIQSALSSAANAKVWRQSVSSSGSLIFETVNDALTASSAWLTVSRSGLSVTGISFNGNVSASSPITAAGFVTSSGTGSGAVFSDSNTNMLRFRVGASTAFKYGVLDAAGNFNVDGQLFSANGAGVVNAQQLRGPSGNNLAVDPGTGGSLYLGYSNGNGIINFGNGASAVVASMSATGVLSLTGLSASSGVVAGGQVSGVGVGGTLDSGANTGLEVRNDGTNSALMSFLRTGAYGIKMGLDTANTFLIGGWSQGTNVVRVQWDTAGNQVTMGNVTAFSDIRFKAGIESIQGMVGRLLSMPNGSFTYTDTRSGQRMVGVSAQDLQAVMPEAVLTNDDGHLSVAYGNAALAALIGVTREFNERISKLEENK